MATTPPPEYADRIKPKSAAAATGIPANEPLLYGTGSSSEYYHDIERHGDADLNQGALEIRRAFVRKVYTLLTCQLLLTFIIASVFYSNDSIRSWVQQNFWAYILCTILSFVFLIAMIVVRHKHPWNLILLTAFTICMAYNIGLVVSFHSALVVVEALAITVTIFLVLTLYATYTKRSFEGFGPFLYACLIGVVTASFVQMILVLAFGIYSSALDVILSLVTALLFSAYIIFDTQMILTRLSPEDFILGVVELYLDIINLFLAILRLLDAANSNNR